MFVRIASAVISVYVIMATYLEQINTVVMVANKLFINDFLININIV